LKKRIVSEDKFFNKTMDYIETHGGRDPQIRMMLIYPGDMKKLVSRTTKDRDKLLSCAMMGRNDMRRSFGREELNDNPFD
jgi:hypothetical protein